MSTQSSDYIRRAASYRKEAAAALKGHWRASLGMGLILMLILTIPFAGYMYSFTDYVEQISSSTDASSMMSAAAPISGASMLSFLAMLLVYPLVTLSLNRLSISLVDRSPLKRPVGLHTIACGPRAYFKCIRVLFLQGWYSTWPVLLGYLVMAVVMSAGAFTSAFVQDHEAAVNLMTILASFMIIAIFALVIIAYVRMIGYMPALYLQAVHTNDNARTLLRTSRRLMKGNKGRLFRLCLSFIGWIYLAAIAAGLVASVIANPLSPSLGNLSYAILLVPACLISLPVMLYMNTSIAAFVLGLLADERVQDALSADDLVVELPASDFLANEEKRRSE